MVRLRSGHVVQISSQMPHPRPRNWRPPSNALLKCAPRPSLALPHCFIFLPSPPPLCPSSQVTHLGVQALVEAVNQSPALRCLTLKLEGSCGGDQSAHALAALKDAPTLEALTLCLSGLYNSGAQALGTLREASKLRTLDLDLRDTGVGHAGVEALRRLCGEPGVKARQQVVVRCSLMMGTILCECADCTGFLIPESLPPGTVLAGYKKIS